MLFHYYPDDYIRHEIDRRLPRSVALPPSRPRTSLRIAVRASLSAVAAT